MLVLATVVVWPRVVWGQDVNIKVDLTPQGQAQTIDGFGTALNAGAGASWFQDLYLDDLQASIARVDLTPRFRAPYSDSLYYSPWFGSQVALPGPDGNNVRAYTGPSDYARPYGAVQAPIAVMGPDIEANLAYFDFSEARVQAAGSLAREGLARKNLLGDFKLMGSVFSPAPWLKVASGTVVQQEGAGILPLSGARFPFVWNGNFGGGRLDVSGVPLAVFDDGTGPTSALTQYARSTAAYLRGFQRTYGVQLYAVSIQNELGFEQYYDSCAYPLASQLAAAIRVLRAELDKYPDLASIQLIGPEDLLIDTPYALWQFGGGADIVHKNLRYLHELRLHDPDALSALGFFAVHGAVSDATWRWWVHGWSATPTGTLPSAIDGFTAYGRKSWMTETSGDTSSWPRPDEGVADRGALSLALRVHRALTSGQQSAWLHWQFADGDEAGPFTLTDARHGANAPKYVAFKHFARWIRPGARRVQVAAASASEVLTSAYVHAGDRTLTAVLINTSTVAQTVTIGFDGMPSAVRGWYTYTSSFDRSWALGTPTVSAERVTLSVPAYGVVTLQGSL